MKSDYSHIDWDVLADEILAGQKINLRLCRICHKASKIREDARVFRCEFCGRAEAINK